MAEYLKSKDHNFSMTTSKDHDLLFDPTEWHELCPECSCYGHDDYKVYKLMANTSVRYP